MDAQPTAALTTEAEADFDAFVANVEQVLARRADSDEDFLWTDEEASRQLALRDGEILVERIDNVPQIDHGSLHVWLGAMFVPEARASAVVDVLKDYDQHQEYYPLR